MIPPPPVLTVLYLQLCTSNLHLLSAAAKRLWKDQAKTENSKLRTNHLAVMLIKSTI